MFPPKLACALEDIITDGKNRMQLHNKSVHHPHYFTRTKQKCVSESTCIMGAILPKS